MKKRCDKLIAKLCEKNIDAAIITSPVNRRYFSGFTGSNGVVIVTENGRVLTSVIPFRQISSAPEFAKFVRLTAE